MSLLFHSKTKRELDSFLLNPTHSLAIFAPEGAGKLSVAVSITENILGIPDATKSSHVLIIRPAEKGSIGIEDTRDIAAFLKLKMPGLSTLRRVVIIEDAHQLTIEAQNALLKTLEEPVQDALIILTATNRQALLPTINSRLKSIELHAPRSEDAINFLQQQFSKEEAIRAWLMSDGRIGLAMSFLHESDHPLVPYIATAKRVISASPYERLSMVDQLTKQDVGLFFEALSIVSAAGFRQAVNKNSSSQEKRWHTVRKAIFKSKNSLRHNPNNKLLLSNLMLEL